ncbi:hypothetical protein [Paenibacillus elgii]|uniref:hypothetical protein n=1 Tax=Paenibacillus elgii TaxID=189691 RepID=UPI000248C29F|nr:hypothetical protein [Paenibacillus elgii]
MLDAGVANTVIDTWMSPAWKELDVKRQEAEQAGDGTAAAAYEVQADYIHWLANELRKTSGQQIMNGSCCKSCEQEPFFCIFALFHVIKIAAQG